MGSRQKLITFHGNGARGRAFIGVDVRALVDNVALMRGNPIQTERIIRTTFTIELKMDVADDEQMKIVQEILKTAAQTLFAQTVLLAGKRAPMIALRSENSYIGQADIELHSPSEE